MAILIQTGIPTPGIRQSTRLNQMAEALEKLVPGQCVTLPCDDEDVQRKTAQLLHAARRKTSKAHPHRRFISRRMQAEVNGKIVLVARMWRMDDAQDAA